MRKDWRLYAYHILDCIKKIKLIKSRGDITSDEVLYDACLRNLQTLSRLHVTFLMSGLSIILLYLGRILVGFGIF